jgi:hypothetical protein
MVAAHADELAKCERDLVPLQSTPFSMDASCRWSGAARVSYTVGRDGLTSDIAVDGVANAADSPRQAECVRAAAMKALQGQRYPARAQACRMTISIKFAKRPPG